MKHTKLKPRLTATSTNAFLLRNKQLQYDKNKTYQEQLVQMQMNKAKLSESSPIYTKKLKSISAIQEKRPVKYLKKKRNLMNNSQILLKKKLLSQSENFNSIGLLNGKFKKIKKIGSGSFSVVYLCRDVEKEKYVVVKEMDLETLNSPAKFFNLQVNLFILILE
jgi:hypothetical protein